MINYGKLDWHQGGAYSVSLNIYTVYCIYYLAISVNILVNSLETS